MSTLISGSLAYDYIMNFPDSFKNHIMPEQIHILNVSFMVDRLERSWGGTAGNIAYTLKLLGGEPIVLSALGKDSADYLKYFKKHKISTKWIQIDESQFSASAYLTTDADDNQISAFYPGPLALAADVSIRQIKENIGIALISPTHKDAMTRHLRECRELGIPVIFDPGQQITAFSGEELHKLVEQSDMVISNDYEMKLIQDRLGWDMNKILGETRIVITTLGEKGSIISTREGNIEIKPCPPKSFDDPTGAGDSFRAGFFFGYEKGMDLKSCGQIGSVAASYAIETFGTQEHTFTKTEFCDRYQKTYGETIII